MSFGAAGTASEAPESAFGNSFCVDLVPSWAELPFTMDGSEAFVSFEAIGIAGAGVTDGFEMTRGLGCVDETSTLLDVGCLTDFSSVVPSASLDLDEAESDTTPELFGFVSSAVAIGTPFSPVRSASSIELLRDCDLEDSVAFWCASFVFFSPSVAS